jgi:hypothetical protein
MLFGHVIRVDAKRTPTRFLGSGLTTQSIRNEARPVPGGPYGTRRRHHTAVATDQGAELRHRRSRNWAFRSELVRGAVVLDAMPQAAGMASRRFEARPWLTSPELQLS